MSRHTSSHVYEQYVNLHLALQYLSFATYMNQLKYLPSIFWATSISHVIITFISAFDS